MTRLCRALFSVLAAVIAVAAILVPERQGVPLHVHGIDDHESWPLAGARAALAQAQVFLEPFTGAPASPQAWRPTAWDVQVSHMERDSWAQLPPTVADHGANCSAPPATHVVTSHEASVFQCNDHVMTTISSGYGIVYLTPNGMVDFGDGEASIRFDLSTLRSSARDWIDLWVTPYGENLALPLDDGVDLSGPPRRAVHIRMRWNGLTFFDGEVYRNFMPTHLAPLREDGFETLLTPSAAVREPFELRISRTRVRFGMPSRNMWWLDNPISDLGWTQGVVQLGHHTYSAEKLCVAFNTATREYDEVRLPDCPNTWHWDNVRIEPVVPFTILRADRRFVDRTTSPSVAFPAPAPAGSFLRFGGVGRWIEVSFNGGTTWQAAQPQAHAVRPDANKFSSYWTPVPAGTTRVSFRGDGDVIDWMARDISIFSGVSSPNPPTPTPTSVAATATPIPTSIPPTATSVSTVCSPRPRVITRVVRESPGVLRATISATGANNTLRRIDFEPRNAVVRRSGLPDQSGPFSMTPQATSTSFQILQRTPGTGAVVRLAVTDACGTWVTFVGGGRGAF
jgi:hypothetical protein